MIINLFEAMKIAKKDGGEAVEALLEQGVDLEVRDGWGRTPLHKVVSNGNVELCRALVDAGADVEAQGVLGYRRRERALSIAASWGNDGPGPELCRILLDAGAEVRHRGCSGWTALHIAAANGGVEACLLLANAGADIEARTYDGRTLRDVAAPEIRSVIDMLVADRAAKVLQETTPKIEIPSPDDALDRLRRSPQQEVAPRARRL